MILANLYQMNFAFIQQNVSIIFAKLDRIAQDVIMYNSRYAYPYFYDSVYQSE